MSLNAVFMKLITSRFRKGRQVTGSYHDMPWGRLNMKMSSYRYRIPILKIIRSRDHLVVNTGDPYTLERLSLYRDRPWILFYHLTTPVISYVGAIIEK